MILIAFCIFLTAPRLLSALVSQENHRKRLRENKTNTGDEVLIVGARVRWREKANQNIYVRTAGPEQRGHHHFPPLLYTPML